MGNASLFTYFDSGTFNFAPLPGSEGVYNISINLTDDNPKPKSISYSFLLTVIPAVVINSTGNFSTLN